MEEMVPDWKGNFPVMVIAHRGFSGAAPEKTLASFKKAIEMGSDMIELDVQFSKDRKIVVRHDETLERTTNGRGRVVDYTLKELKNLDVGSWFGTPFSGEQIPTFKEALELAKGRVLVNAEIKSPTHGQYAITELTDQALKEVKKAGMINRVIFSSFNPAALEWIKKDKPGVRVALLYHGPWNFLSEVTGGKEYSVLNLRHTHLTKRKVVKIHQEGYKVNAYTVNSRQELDRLVRWKVDGIITNHPDRLIQILQKKME